MGTLSSATLSCKWCLEKEAEPLTLRPSCLPWGLCCLHWCLLHVWWLPGSSGSVGYQLLPCSLETWKWAWLSWKETIPLSSRQPFPPRPKSGIPFPSLLSVYFLAFSPGPWSFTFPLSPPGRLSSEFRPWQRTKIDIKGWECVFISEINSFHSLNQGQGKCRMNINENILISHLGTHIKC